MYQCYWVCNVSKHHRISKKKKNQNIDDSPFVWQIWTCLGLSISFDSWNYKTLRSNGKIPSVCSRTISLHTQFNNELGKIRRSIFCSMAFYRTTQPLSLANDQAPHSLFLTFIIIYSDKQTKWSSLHSLVNYSISFYFTIKLNPITTMRLICKILCVSQPFINQTYFILHASMRN